MHPEMYFLDFTNKLSINCKQIDLILRGIWTQQCYVAVIYMDNAMLCSIPSMHTEFYVAG